MPKSANVATTRNVPKRKKTGRAVRHATAHITRAPDKIRIPQENENDRDTSRIIAKLLFAALYKKTDGRSN